MRLLDQLRGLPEVGVPAGAIDQRISPALTDNGARVDGFAGLALDGQRLTGQRRLIHFHRVAFQQAGVGGHDVAETKANEVSGHQFPRRDGTPFPIAPDAGPNRQLGLERGDSVTGLVFLPETDRRIGQ